MPPSAPSPSPSWLVRGRLLHPEERGLIMGVLNVTADSFSDGGRYLDLDAALRHARKMIAEGADIIDIGGESTRPGATPIGEDEEMRRVLPVIERLAAESEVLISIDTMKWRVAAAAVAAGAAIVNDVAGLRSPEMRGVVRDTGAGAIAMHMQGEPRTMQEAPSYGDVTAEIREFFVQTLEGCLGCGIDAMQLAFDPGIGFGKTMAHNLEILQRLERVRVPSRPLALGVSRKSFLGKIVDSPVPEDRLWPTVAVTAFARHRGASIIRVHDVRENAHALRMVEAILAA